MRHSTKQAPRCRMLCFGNSLHGDDGFGPAVHAALQPLLAACPQLECHVVGTRGLDALTWFEPEVPLILVDVLLTDDVPPGQLAWASPADLMPESEQGALPLLHGAGLGELLQLARIFQLRLPEISVLLASTQAITPFSLALSAPLRAAVVAACAAIAARLDLSSGMAPCSPVPDQERTCV